MTLNMNGELGGIVSAGSVGLTDTVLSVARKMSSLPDGKNVQGSIFKISFSSESF